MDFSEALKRFREEKHLTQKQIADTIRIRERSYQRYEHGQVKPSIDMVRRIADAYNVSIDYLVGRTDNPEIKR